MDVSIIIPVLNEEHHIEALLTSVYQSSNCKIEVFLCDAGSSDNTLQIARELAFPNLHIEHNPQKFVSFAFNNTFPKTKGKYIALLGAHAHYPAHYFDTAINYLETECDVVGGPLIQLGKTPVGDAIAFAMSSKFGVGGSGFRTEKKKMFVDTVAFAVYKREIFTKIGLLDESLLRNQDDELHYRMNANGYTILMVPEMECSYYVRNSFSTLFNQYFQYGLYKPLVFKKVQSGLRLKHIIPSLFISYLLLLPIAYYFVQAVALLPLLCYITSLVIFSIPSTPSIQSLFLRMIAFATLHMSYGTGFLLGLPRYFTSPKRA